MTSTPIPADPCVASQLSRSTVRRQRQVLEIARLVVDGATERATGLALEHAAEFPEDSDLVGRMTANQSTEVKPR